MFVKCILLTIKIITKIMKKANFSIKFTSELKEDINQNYFSNIPIDIYHLLHNPDGTFAKIVDELEPNTMYEI